MNWFFFCSLLSPWFQTRDALPKEDNSCFCQCHWSARQIFVPFGNHNVFFFCYSQQMLFNAVDGFWIYYCSLYENPMNGNNRNNDKNIASEWEQPNKLMRSEITRKKWNERTLKRERDAVGQILAENTVRLREIPENQERQLKRGQQINEWNII